MYEKNDKRYLYWIIDLYLENKINTESFSNSFNSSYVIEIDKNNLEDWEYCIFNKIDTVTGRYNEDTSDIPENLKYFFYTGDEVRILVKKAKESLDGKKDMLPDFENVFEKIKV